MHYIVGNPVAFFLRRFLTKTPTSLRALLSANAMAKLSMSPRVRMRDENTSRTIVNAQCFEQGLTY